MAELSAEHRERLADKWAHPSSLSDLEVVVADLIVDAQREAAQAVLDAVERTSAYAVTVAAARAAAAKYGAGS
jgi:ABC-type nitrate/sulfonate/bicarbonate transport system substrate-binding protein